MYLDLHNPRSGPRPGRTVEPVSRSSAVDDAAMLRRAAQLTRELGAHKPAIYWTDFLLSALVGYAALALAILAGPMIAKLGAGLVSVLALYRAGSFMHEITHMKRGDVPGFAIVWNILAGVPLMMPSFMYEGVHSLHHARNRYGTARDPEYLPLALMRPTTLPVFLLAAALAPIGFLIRFGVLAPLSALSARLRAVVVERFSAIAINPGFRREVTAAGLPRGWLLLEAATSIWALGLIAGVTTGLLPLAGVLT